MENIVKVISKWQVDAGNASKPYDDFLESAFQIEEALEGFKIPFEKLFDENEQCIIDGTVEKKRHQSVARDIISWVINNTPEPISEVERLDKACDAIVYAIGSMAKLGLDHQGITKALLAVNKANQQKLGQGRDEKDKLLKPSTFVGPEPELQLILDARKVKHA